MRNLQNEFYYKNLLQIKIAEFITEVTEGDNELGYLSENIDGNMTEAAWLILKQSIDTSDLFESEGMLIKI